MTGWECRECDAQAKTEEKDAEGLVGRAREVHERTTGHRTVTLSAPEQRTATDGGQNRQRATGDARNRHDNQ